MVATGLVTSLLATVVIPKRIEVLSGLRTRNRRFLLGIGALVALGTGLAFLVVEAQDDAAERFTDSVISAVETAIRDDGEAAGAPTVTKADFTATATDVSSTEPALERSVELPLTDLGGDLLDILNAARVGQGLQPLAFDEDLSVIATVRSIDMVRFDYFGHERDAEVIVGGMLDSAGYDYTAASELISRNNFGERAVAETAKSWLGDDAHNAFLLDPKFTTTGIGIAQIDDFQFVFTLVLTD